MLNFSETLRARPSAAPSRAPCIKLLARGCRRMKIACIVGTRPNFIKVAPIISALKEYSDALQPVLVHTGQHRDANLSDIFFRELQIPTPHYQLGVGQGTPAQQTSAIM